MNGPPASSSVKLREGIRIAIRVVLSMGAALASAVMAAGLFATDDSLGIRIGVAVFLAVVGWSPLIGHIRWGRRHPIQDKTRPARFAAQGEGPYVGAPQQFLGPPAQAPPQRGLPPSAAALFTQLTQIRGAAAQLATRTWISDHDSAAIDQRLVRLMDLAQVDAQSQQVGGSASAGLRREVGELHTTVIGLLDAAIESSAVAPGDDAVDSRLAAHLDRLHSRTAAVAELENRIGTEPSTGSATG